MNSRIDTLYDYHDVDIRSYRITFTPDQQKIEAELKRLVNKYIQWVDGETVGNGDIVICSLTSDNAKYCKDNLKLCIGAGLFDKALEAEIAGMRKGETKESVINGTSVTIKVSCVTNKIVPEPTDKMVQDLQMEGIGTVEDYKAHLLHLQKEEAVDNASYPAVEYVLQQVEEKSDFIIKRKDLERVAEIELKRCSALASQDGLKLTEMTENDFKGRIPVKSYQELLLLVRDNAWKRLIQYLIGQYYALKDGFAVTQEQYEKDIEEYAAYWHVTRNMALESNAFDNYEISQYVIHFCDKVRAYVKEILMKEAE